MATKTGYATRKGQIEKGFLKALTRDLKVAGCVLNKKARALVRETLKDAAMVAACEERSRTLDLLDSYDSTVRVRSEVTKQSVLKVLGYEK